MNAWRINRLASLCLLFALLCAIVSFALLWDGGSAAAQTPDATPAPSNPIRYLPADPPPGGKLPTKPSGGSPILFLPLIGNAGAAEAAADGGISLDASRQTSGAIKLLVDTDPGVDDAIALTWLMRQKKQPLQMLGIVTVAGNTTVANATNNALLVLEQLQRPDVPVVMGAAAPRVQPLSKTTWFIHGPDGLWFMGWQNPHDLSGVRTDAAAFYCETVGANAGAQLLALGPLTNIAQAVEQCPDTMKTLSHLVILGGAKYGGNQTPVAEFNFWQDPEAAAIVLNAGLPITLVLLDAFTDPTIAPKGVTVTPEQIAALFRGATPAIQFLAPAIQQYLVVQLTNSGSAGVPDVVAAVIALDPSVGERQGALVRVVLEPGLARGESIVGLTANEKVTMIAGDDELSTLAERAFAYPPDPNFNLELEMASILMRAPDNAQAVISAPENLLTKIVLPDLKAK